MNMGKYISERNAVLLSLDKSKIKHFAKKWGINMPTNEEAFWRGVHKAICAISDIPFDVRQRSADWLFEHGSTPEIFGGTE